MNHRDTNYLGYGHIEQQQYRPSQQSPRFPQLHRPHALPQPPQPPPPPPPPPPLPPSYHSHPPPRRRRSTPPPRPHMRFVGQPGYPEPSPESQEKAPFTPEDDAKLKQLKEQTNPVLTWRQIGDFFPGRSFNTLQVHYCTKIKGANHQWTPDLDEALRCAVKQDDMDRGKRIAKALGNGFKPQDCEERIRVLDDMSQEAGESEAGGDDASAAANREATKSEPAVDSSEGRSSLRLYKNSSTPPFPKRTMDRNTNGEGSFYGNLPTPSRSRPRKKRVIELGTYEAGESTGPSGQLEFWKVVKRA